MAQMKKFDLPIPEASDLAPNKDDPAKKRLDPPSHRLEDGPVQ